MPNADDNDLDCAMYSPPPGVVTKCEVQSPQDQHQKTFEMKVNISGTEFVLLENLGTLDTNAVVLKVGLYFTIIIHVQVLICMTICTIQVLIGMTQVVTMCAIQVL